MFISINNYLINECISAFSEFLIDLNNKMCLIISATFTYPVGGRIIFRQEADEPLSDTMVSFLLIWFSSISCENVVGCNDSLYQNTMLALRIFHLPSFGSKVYVEGLVYTDGSKNQSDSHAWHVHNEVPGKDFFNWTGRCLSAGGHFNPYRISKEDG